MAYAFYAVLNCICAFMEHAELRVILQQSYISMPFLRSVFSILNEITNFPFSTSLVNSLIPAKIMCTLLLFESKLF